MISTDESALICDFAETYHIYDYRALPLKTAAVLACGLRDNSRIKMKMADMAIPPDMVLMAAALDRLSMLVWAKTEDGAKGRKRPQSVLEKMLNSKKNETGLRGFDTAEEFEAARQRHLRKGG